MTRQPWLILLTVLTLSSCGDDRVVRQDDTIPSDINSAQANEFNEKVSGVWSNTFKTPEGDSVEGHSFKPSSHLLTGTLGYFCSDASGEVPYEFISKRPFERNNEHWVAWLIQDKFFKDRSIYYVICHADVSKPQELYFYRYAFSNVDDCFAKEAKELRPYVENPN